MTQVVTTKTDGPSSLGLLTSQTDRTDLLNKLTDMYPQEGKEDLKRLCEEHNWSAESVQTALFENPKLPQWEVSENRNTRKKNKGKMEEKKVSNHKRGKGRRKQKDRKRFKDKDKRKPKERRKGEERKEPAKLLIQRPVSKANLASAGSWAQRVANPPKPPPKQAQQNPPPNHSISPATDRSKENDAIGANVDTELLPAPPGLGPSVWTQVHQPEEAEDSGYGGEPEFYQEAEQFEEVETKLFEYSAESNRTYGTDYPAVAEPSRPAPYGAAPVTQFEQPVKAKFDQPIGKQENSSSFSDHDMHSQVSQYSRTLDKESQVFIPESERTMEFRISGAESSEFRPVTDSGGPSYDNRILQFGDPRSLPADSRAVPDSRAGDYASISRPHSELNEPPACLPATLNEPAPSLQFGAEHPPFGQQFNGVTMPAANLVFETVRLPPRNHQLESGEGEKVYMFGNGDLEDDRKMQDPPQPARAPARGGRVSVPTSHRMDSYRTAPIYNELARPPPERPPSAAQRTLHRLGVPAEINEQKQHTYDVSGVKTMDIGLSSSLHEPRATHRIESQFDERKSDPHIEHQDSRNLNRMNMSHTRENRKYDHHDGIPAEVVRTGPFFDGKHLSDSAAGRIFPPQMPEEPFKQVSEDSQPSHMYHSSQPQYQNHSQYITHQSAFKAKPGPGGYKDAAYNMPASYSAELQGHEDAPQFSPSPPQPVNIEEYAAAPVMQQPPSGLQPGPSVEYKAQYPNTYIQNQTSIPTYQTATIAHYPSTVQYYNPSAAHWNASPQTTPLQSGYHLRGPVYSQPQASQVVYPSSGAYNPSKSFILPYSAPNQHG